MTLDFFLRRAYNEDQEKRFHVSGTLISDKKGDDRSMAEAMKCGEQAFEVHLPAELIAAVTVQAPKSGTGSAQ